MTSLMQPILRPPSPLYPLRLDWPLLAGCLALTALGLVMITSASIDMASLKKGNPYHFLHRQCLHFLLGLLVTLVFLQIPLALWRNRKVGGWLWITCIILLGLLLLFARPVNGALRWFDIGVFKVQPTELVKLFVIIILAGYLTHRREHLHTHWKGALIPLAGLLPIVVLLNEQPDLGSVLLLFGVSGGMLFLAGLNLRYLLPLAALLVAGLLYLSYAEPYRIERLMLMFDPMADPNGSGYQVQQSLIAFARGGWFGVGLGNSVQKHFYLPEAHTDFIIAILAEELGFTGVLACLALFAFVCLRTLWIGVRAERAGLSFSAYLAYGLALLWMAQTLIHFAVNMGRAPTKGLALPFVSYGGSALLACCAGLGLLLRIDWECRQVLAARAGEESRAEGDMPDWLEGLRHD